MRTLLSIKTVAVLAFLCCAAALFPMASNFGENAPEWIIEMLRKQEVHEINDAMIRHLGDEKITITDEGGETKEVLRRDVYVPLK